MSDDQVPPQPPSTPPPPPDPPPPPPDPPAGAAPPPPPPGPGTGTGAASSNRSLWIVLSYLWIFALIPYLLEQDDREAKWHARHGLVLTGAEIAFWIVFWIVSMIANFIPFAGCLFGLGGLLIWLAFIGLRVFLIVKGLNGERFLIPGLSEFADRF